MVYQIYCCPDNQTMRTTLMQSLTYLIDFDSASFYLAGSGNQKLSAPILYHLDPAFGEKYLSVYDELDYSEGLMFTGRSMTYRESDIMSDQDRQATPYYQIFYRAYHLHYSLHLSITYENHFLGILSLFRQSGRPDFTQRDLETLGLLTNHLEARLTQDRQKQVQATDKLTVTAATQKFQLTNRQQLILQKLLAGLDNATICEQLYITNNTLKKHILNIYRKLQINSRIQLFTMIEN
ncbi:LuxR C-terminal-related transcriptional regulator [Loigolactobacillus bifermentans]|uniref:LuxR C-terminal-related transcriptional regulator n=1 Tax=Loigolactobacillus bifermentans TaxID=1607 RepID=UPI0023D9E65A|nr:LuxR C-terminal-related transcriptional regulator [Loigolactobacillus bifermentans]